MNAMTDNKIKLKQARKVTVVESIVEQLVKQIQDGVLKPGDKLPSERRLIEMLGVGRSSVREALQGLVMMGLVESHQGQGSFVRQNLYSHIPELTAQSDLSTNLQCDMRLQLIEARRLVEIDIAELAAGKALPEQIENLQNDFHEYVRYIDDFSDQRYLNAHNDFHLALAHMTGNPFYVIIVDTLLQAIPQTLREREFAFPQNLDLQQLRQDQIQIHRAILEAVALNDSTAAGIAMRDHMDFEHDLVLQVYQDTQDA